MMLAYPPGAAAEADFAKLRAYAEQEGRDPASIGVEVWVSTGAGDETTWREEFKSWKNAGVTHVTLNSAFHRNHHQRIASRSLQGHLTALDQYRDAVADLL
jgi:alkanesulfonate monooxygenase SsuD/methylene tetrahydromethanopterin reductase-like flavin-dependent oxidoreductase (luciferase family)